MPKSNTKISKQTLRKTNPEIVETIKLAKKNKFWFRIAEILSGPRKKIPNINLDKIDKQSKENEIIAVPGKVLSMGEISKNKKIKIAAFSFSDKAKEKLNKSKIEFSYLKDEIKKNPEGKNIKILIQ